MEGRGCSAFCAALAALGALAAAPSMASAAVTLQDTVGTETAKVEVGKKLIADTDPGSTLKFGSSIGSFECNENVLTGQIIRNDGEEVRWTIEGAWFQSNLTVAGTTCKTPFGEVTVTFPTLTSEGGKGHWCLRTIPNKDEWELWGNGCETEPGGGELTFVFDNEKWICAYTKTGSIKGTLTTVSATHEAATLALSGAPEFKTEQPSSFICQTAWKIEEFKFNLYTDTDAELPKTHSTHTFGAQPTADPVFFNPVA